jgi:hypothetical protein
MSAAGACVGSAIAGVLAILWCCVVLGKRADDERARSLGGESDEQEDA